MNTLTYIIDLLYYTLGSVLEWVYSLLSSFGLSAEVLIVGAVGIFAVMKFVVSPYLTGSSDSAKNSKNKKG